MKIAVTGANGFIGRHVVAELEQRSISPILIVRPGSITPPSWAKHTVIPVELSDPPENLFKSIGSPDVVIHLAWGGLPNYKSHHHFEKELPLHYQFIKKLIESGLKNLIVTGSCAEYGMQWGCLNENCNPQPNHAYGFAKDSLRRQLEFLQKINPFNLTWARLFYLYGEGQNENSLLMQLKKAIEKKEKFFNMSGGEQLRDYLPITQAANYLVSLALNFQNNGIVNVCSGSAISIRNLVEKWLYENNWSINLNLGYYPYLDYEPIAFWGSCEKLYVSLNN